MNTVVSKTPRGFAPLLNHDPTNGKFPRLKGIIFDLHGTLCLPQASMFKQMRSALRITKKVDIHDHCYSLPPEKQNDAFQKIRNIEAAAMSDQVPQPGLVELMSFLEQKKVSKAICTRSFDAPAKHFLDKFLPGNLFSPMITRNFHPPKPDPAGILHIAKTWGLMSENMAREPTPDARALIMVGYVTLGVVMPNYGSNNNEFFSDSIDDMIAGRRAGAVTVLLENNENGHILASDVCDLGISRLDDLIGILIEGIVLDQNNA